MHIESHDKETILNLLYTEQHLLKEDGVFSENHETYTNKATGPIRITVRP